MTDLLRAGLVVEALANLIVETVKELEARVAVLELQAGIAPPAAAANTMRRVH